MYYSKLGHVSLLVKDYEEALAFYINVLKFYILEDSLLEDNNTRWILISPTPQGETSLLLVKASHDSQARLIGRQCEDAVLLFLYTIDMSALYEQLLADRVSIVSNPFEEKWGIIMKIKDVYGNLIEIIQPI